MCREVLGHADSGVERALRFACDEVVPRILRTPDEPTNPRNRRVSIVVQNGAPGKAGFSPTKTHPSGYTWREQEQEPGYAWTSKKAQDEYKRAADQMVHKESAVRGR